jgi:hypothetical protein
VTSSKNRFAASVSKNVADLVDDDQLVAVDLLQLGLQLPGVVGAGEPVDPVGSSRR